LPLITSYAIDKVKPRKPKRLMDHRDRIIQRVARDYERSPFYRKFLDR
jgi:phenylacetate-coenzyme A ligase PaaK-like adenylate-forming protein